MQGDNQEQDDDHDATMSLIITAINLIGGIIIGMVGGQGSIGEIMQT